MCLNQKPQEPIMVRVPGTNRFINILPFFYYLEEYCQGKPEHLVARMENLIRFISLNFDKDSEPLELKNNLATVFDLKDMFANMQEYKSC